MARQLSRRRFLAAGSGAIGIAAVAAACGGRRGSAGGPGVALNGAPVHGGTLTFSDTQAVTTWQNQNLTTYSSGNILFSVLTYLLYYDPNQKRLVPWIASAWSKNDANTEFTFTIRPGVTFSDGTPLTPDVVRQNYDRFGLGDTALRIPPNPYIAPGYDHAELVGDNAVKIVLTSPNESFPVATTRIQAGLLGLSTLKLDVDAAGEPGNVVGAGPFVFQSQVPNESVTLMRRPDYRWPPASFPNQGPAYLDKVVWRVLPELGLRTGALSSGQVDVARGIQPADEAGLQDCGYQILVSRPTLGSSNYASIRIDNPLVSDRRVRQALLIGIDREQLSETVLSPSYPPAKSILNAVNPAFIDLSAEFAYNPSHARALLDQAGWRTGSDGVRANNGTKLVLTVPQDAQQVALGPAWDYIAQQWRQELNIVLNVRTDAAFAAEAETEQSVPLSVSRTSIISLGQNFGSKGNTTLLASPPDLLALYQQELSSADDAALNRVQAREQRLLIEQAYVIPTFEEGQVYGASSKVHVEFTATTYPLFHTAWKQS